MWPNSLNILIGVLYQQVQSPPWQGAISDAPWNLLLGATGLTVALIIALIMGTGEKPRWYSGPVYRALEVERADWKKVALEGLSTQAKTVETLEEAVGIMKELRAVINELNDIIKDYEAQSPQPRKRPARAPSAQSER